MRNIPTLKKYVNRFNKIPKHIAFGFASYLLFTKPVEIKDGKYYGEVNGRKYFINDDKASYFYEIWKEENIHKVVYAVISNEELWQEDLSNISGFAESVENYLNLFITEGPAKMLAGFN